VEPGTRETTLGRVEDLLAAVGLKLGAGTAHGGSFDWCNAVNESERSFA
jgi:hypothetical protein